MTPPQMFEILAKSAPTLEYTDISKNCFFRGREMYLQAHSVAEGGPAAVAEHLKKSGPGTSGLANTQVFSHHLTDFVNTLKTFFFIVNEKNLNM